MPAATDADVVRRGYDAFASGDIETLRRDIFAPDIRWHQPGRNPIAGDFAGIDAVLGAFRNWFELSGGTFKAAVHDVLASDQHVVVLGAISAQRGGKSIRNGNFCQVVHMSNGKISEVWVAPVDPYESDDFWT